MVRMKIQQHRPRRPGCVELTTTSLASVAGGAPAFGRLPAEIRGEVYERSVENNPRGVVEVFGKDPEAKRAYDRSNQVNTRGETISAGDKAYLWDTSRDPALRGIRMGWEYGGKWDHSRTP